MRIGEARAAEIRHRVRLAPDDVVEHPEIEILERRADAENVVVAADHPERAIGLQHPPRRLQPGAREDVVMGKALELVPVVVDRIDLALVGPGEALLELQVVGRIGKDQVDRARRQGVHLRHAVADEDGVERERRPLRSGRSRPYRAVRNIRLTLTQH